MKKPKANTLFMGLIVVLTGVNLFVAMDIYRGNSEPEVLPCLSGAECAAPSSGVNVNDIRTLLTQNLPRRATYQIIATKNLFSAKRAAWHAPVAETVRSRTVSAQARRTNVVLFGTFSREGKMGAMLEFSNLKPGQNRKTLYPGETITLNAGRKKASYTLVSVDQTSVAIKDQSGAVYRLDLYDDKKVKKARPVAKTTIEVARGRSTAETSSVVAGSVRATEDADVVDENDILSTVQR